MIEEMPMSSVTVRIAGEEHTIRANAEPEYTRRCAELVDARIRQIQKQSGLIETHKAAILAALSIADEFLQAQEELDQHHREVASRVRNLTRRLRDGVEAASPGDDSAG